MGIGRLVVRLAILVAVMSGIVAMHHVAGVPDAGVGHRTSAAIGHSTGGDAPAAYGDRSSDGAGADEGHGLLHLCMAVLTAAVVLVAALLLVAWRGMPTPLLRLRPAAFLEPRIRPPPRRHGVSLLRFVCVLRT